MMAISRVSKPRAKLGELLLSELPANRPLRHIVEFPLDGPNIYLALCAHLLAEMPTEVGDQIIHRPQHASAGCLGDKDTTGLLGKSFHARSVDFQLCHVQDKTIQQSPGQIGRVFEVVGR